MGKPATKWSSNTAASTNQRRYDSSSTVYNSSSLTYDGNVSGQSYLNAKTPTAWSRTGKSGIAWSSNTAASTNRRLYDSSSTVYNSGSLTYDGNVTGQSALNGKVPTVWTATEA